jgi:hypothetical protein
MVAKVDCRGTIEERFEAKYIPEPNSGCWLWLGALDGHGYGHIYVGGKYRSAHRVGYELRNGQIPEGLVVDHLCRMPACVNPDHLEPVTQSENLRRSPIMDRYSRLTHCKRGHEFNVENTRIRKLSGHRTCIKCMNMYYQIRKAKNG